MTTVNTSNNKPALTLRDGAIKATIWANENQDGGTRYSVEINRSYTDSDGKWHDTSYFSNGELLRVARLAGKAYDAIGELRAEVNSDANNGAQ